MKTGFQISQYRNNVYYLVIMYYLILSYFVTGEIYKYSFEYFLFVVPIILFIGLFSPYLATNKYSKRGLICLVLLVIVFLVSIVRLDLSSILSIFLFSATLIVIFNSGIIVSYRFVNFLFLISIVGSVISYHMGVNEFGYIPNFQGLSSIVRGGVGWRISLFPLVPESGFFALLIIMVNYYLNTSRSRYVFYILGLYFLVFSASRTSLVIFAFFISFILITKFFPFRQRTLYSILNPVMIIFFIALLSFKSILLLMKDTKIDFLNEYLFRSEEGISEEIRVEDVATRNWIWAQHFKIYMNSPVFGVGTFNFNDYKDDNGKVYHQSSGSESFITALLARIGLPALLVVYLLFHIQGESTRKRNPFVYILTLYIIITMISYGSFMVAYNFMFLLLFGLTNNTKFTEGNQ